MLVPRRGELLGSDLPGVCVAEMQKNPKSLWMQNQKQQYQKELFYVLGLMFWFGGILGLQLPFACLSHCVCAVLYGDAPGTWVN